MSHVEKAKSLSDHELLGVWQALERYDPREFLDKLKGVSMDDWAEVVYAELDMRGLPKSYL